MFLLLAATALAQVVNVQPLLQPVEDGLHLEASAGGSYLTGNVPFLTARGALLARYRRGAHTLISSSRAEFGRGGGDPFLNRQTSHLRYQNRWSDRFVAETFLQATHDLVWRLQLRALVGAGGRVDLLNEDPVRLQLGVGYMFEHDRLSREPGATDSLARLYHHRLNSYGTLAWRLDDTLTLVQSAYLQPRFDLPRDLRVFSHTSLVIKVKDRLALSASFQLAHNSRPPETIQPTDTTTLWDFTWSF